MSLKSSRLRESVASLEPRRDVTSAGSAFIANTVEPWLSISPGNLFEPGRFFQLSYEIPSVDPPTRPILRFWIGPESYRDHILPAPIEGRGLALIRTPDSFTQVWISPTNRTGPFEFALTGVRNAACSDIIGRLARSPKRAFFAMAAGWVGLQEEADLNWRFALGSAPLHSYRALRERLDVGPPTQSCDDRGKSGRLFWFVVNIDRATPAQIEMSCASIERQSARNWRARLVGSPASADFPVRRAWERRPGFAPDETPRPEDFVSRIEAGDVVARNAVACFDAHLWRNPGLRLVYCDEIQLQGGVAAPVFKPAWSPTLNKSIPYIGRAAFVSAALDTAGETSAGADSLAAGLAPDEIGCVRLPLFQFPATEPTLATLPFDAISKDTNPSVSIIIPTRDKAGLLQACLQSLFERTAYGDYEVVLVDNDSVEPQTHRLMRELATSNNRLKILKIPGDFNFSKLCNAGVRASRGEFLLFLNNDTQIIAPDWIHRLLFFARDPDVGAVGAKLLYPNRKTQHVGVLLGMGGVAGHFGAGLDESAPGWWRRNLVPHEVSAVTGACLMVARRKFEAAGGFDEINLPVDLNDVDLCLRLAERGWRTICHSQVVLIHHQSASRGGGLRLQQVYERERRFFRERWRRVIRDDPYFHPGLSLYSATEKLP